LNKVNNIKIKTQLKMIRDDDDYEEEEEEEEEDNKTLKTIIEENDTEASLGQSNEKPKFDIKESILESKDKLFNNDQNIKNDEESEDFNDYFLKAKEDKEMEDKLANQFDPFEVFNSENSSINSFTECNYNNDDGNNNVLINIEDDLTDSNETTIINDKNKNNNNKNELTILSSSSSSSTTTSDNNSFNWFSSQVIQSYIFDKLIIVF
jgi:hypothetical protein